MNYLARISTLFKIKLAWRYKQASRYTYRKTEQKHLKIKRLPDNTENWPVTHDQGRGKHEQARNGKQAV
ncbi:MAG: hypothetical protein IOC39_17325 [Burkholderia sp.]|uniref:hypothetical protein n=2 Tax=Burkholderia sp. TaxID=36773 RepID=UPI0025833E85|nr:hypothetical protein [Burkholderia sp.]MCA3780457.1 hypothetical protein [Burkholderia sp.]MCA3787744.1 hypothetical protein [Burkholderia sp.]MCA3795157.1 hypothetical protein [Burkholderia sp.]MCA3814118.1 hypothetical protein [Burkholderia sp.]MCA3817587.1 hypothetical protein [Burkholderia sp.]